MTSYAPSVHLNNQKLPRLNNAFDYYRWREEATDVFLQKSSKIWRIVKGEYKKPDATLEPDKFEEWTDANYTAVGLLRSSLSIEIKHTINGLDNANEIWKRLEQAFASTMKWRLEEIETEFNSLKQDRLTIDGFVGKIKELSEQLHLGGVTITMHKKYTVLMKGLRREYGNLKAQIEETYRNQRERNRLLVRRIGLDNEEFEVVTEPIDEKAKFDSIVAKLRSKEIELGFHGLNQKTRQHQVALLTETRKPRTGRPKTSTGSKKPERRIEDITCYRCQQKGHYANKCKNERKDKSPREKGKVDNVFSAFSTVSASHADSVDPTRWIFDSGASQHICIDKMLFTTLRPNKDQYIRTADNTLTRADAVGDVIIRVNGKNGDSLAIQLSNVLYIPSFAANLISLGRIQSKATVIMENDTMTIHDKRGNFVCRGTASSNLMYLDVADVGFVALATKQDDSATLWHKRLGHPGKLRLKQTLELLDQNVENVDAKCDTCEKMKSHKQPFPQSRSVTSKPLELVHSDVVGKMPDATFRNQRFAVTFIDDFTHFVVVFLLEHKSEVFDCFKVYKQILENQTGETIKRFRTDNGGEYTSKEFEDFLSVNGIIHESTAPYTPEQNGVAERMNRTLFETTRCLLKQSGAPMSLWGEALLHSAYLANRMPTKAIQATTPAVALTGSQSNVLPLKVFGCTAWAHVPEERRGKLDDRVVKTVFVGIASDTKGYKLFDPVLQTILVTRHATFDEIVFPYKLRTLQNLLSQNVVPLDETIEKGDTVNDLAIPSEAPDNNVTVETTPDSIDISSTCPPIATDEERAAGIFTPPGTPPQSAFHTVDDDIEQIDAESKVDDEPNTIQQAKRRSDWKEWENAIEKELQSHRDNNTWTLVDKPSGCNIIGSRYVFKIKHKGDGSIDKYKARLVAQGYTQKHGIDYEETFAPVIKMSTLRILLILSLYLNLDVYQMDVATAYLNGQIDADLYMRPPPGWETDKVCKLNKALYGLKQAGCTWYEKADSTLLELGFSRSPFDSALYFKKTSTGPPLVLTLYVDDILIFASERLDAETVMSQLRSKFKMTGGDKLSYILGIQVTRGTRSLHLAQTGYLERLLEQFGLANANVVSTPMNPSADLNAGDPLTADAHSVYRTIIGSVLYMATCTRPDISFAVQKLSQHLQNPTENAMTAAKHLLRYLKGTANYGLLYQVNDTNISSTTDWGNRLLSYSDADFAGDTDTRKSTSGIVNTVNGLPYSWVSKRQSLVADSTTFAEYVAMAETSKEILWSCRLLESIGLKIEEPTPLCADNQAAIQLSKDPKFHNRTKHIDVKFHFIREQVISQAISVKTVSTHDQVADILTKPLDRVKIGENRDKIKVLPVTSLIPLRDEGPVNDTVVPVAEAEKASTTSRSN